MITEIVLTDDSNLLQESNLTARQPCYTYCTCTCIKHYWGPRARAAPKVYAYG